MKHLRRFDESLKDELLDFCETYLAYLIDEGFKVRIFEGDDFHQIMIGTSEQANFLWSEVKDQVLPFLHFLFKDYELYWNNGKKPHEIGAESPMGCVYYFMGSIKPRPLTLEQINNLPDNYEMATLYIRVVKKGERVEKAWFRNF
jgi:hypothetical protein